MLPGQSESPVPTGSVPAPFAPAGLVQPQGAKTSGLAIGSLICGLLFFFFPAAIVAIILGHLSLSDIRKSAGRLAGRGIALTGLVLGYSGVLFIPVVLIIAAIAIPNLLRAKMAANEAGAVGSLREISTAAATYSERYSNGFPPSFDAMDGLGMGNPSCEHAQLLDRKLESGRKDGYVFDYVAPVDQRVSFVAPAAAQGCRLAGVASFEVHADPVTRGTTGQRSFFTDQTGVIRYEDNGPATQVSAPLE
jgi:hypothetical protein